MLLRSLKAVRAEKEFLIVMRLSTASWGRGLEGWSRKQREMNVGASIGTMDDEINDYCMTSKELLWVLNVMFVSTCVFLAQYVREE
jgi:hypothetical protein